MPDDKPTVLVFEDERDVAESYELWLSGDYEVRHAEDGPTALEMLDEGVDVVLLDRMMPGTSGDEVLSELRDRGYDCGVAMVSAIDPGFDIIEMGFDDYVTKPPTADELRATVEDLLDREGYSDRVREYRSLVDKREALRAEKSEAELAESEAFAELEGRIDDIEAELDESNERLLDDATFVSMLRDLTGEGGVDDE